VLLVVSHDRELLRHVDRIADLRDGEVHWYGGNIDAYEKALAVEQEAAERTVRAARADVRRQKRDLVEAHDKLAGRLRQGRKAAAAGGMPKIVVGARKRAAQVSAGKHRILHEERLEQARERLDEAAEAVRDDDEIRVDLPCTAVPRGRTVLTLRGLELRCGARAELELRGPERVALVGRNGAGNPTPDLCPHFGPHDHSNQGRRPQHRPTQCRV
jgi:ATPase subunit of ABC transporter with duplicated ATPase domains